MHANKNFGMDDHEVSAAFNDLASTHSKFVNRLIYHALQLPTNDIVVATNYDKKTKEPRADLWLLQDSTSDVGALFGNSS